MFAKSFFILALILLKTLMPLQVKADGKDPIRVGGDENYPPYEFVDKKGVYRGFNVDIMRAISIEIGREIEIIPMPWQNAIKALDNKEVDVIQGMSRSEYREKKYVFTDQQLKDSQVIFVRKDTQNVSELSDLSGLKVGVQSGDVCEELVNNHRDIKVVEYKDQQEAIEALLKNEVDATIGDKLTGLYILQNIKQFNDIKIVGEPLYNTEYASVALRENQEIIQLLNKGLRAIKINGQYDKIYSKWYGETLLESKFTLTRYIRIISAVLCFVITVIFIIFYWNRTLKKIVLIKTKELESTNKKLKAQQEMLEKSNRLRGKILESILDGIIVFDKEGKFLVANSAARKFLKLKENDKLKIEDISFEGIRIYEEYLKDSKGEAWARNLELKKISGEILNIDCRIYPIKDGENIIQGSIIVFHDFTESRLLSDAKELDKLKTEFFANMSHELRTPLNIIYAAAQLLESNIENYNEDNIKGFINRTVSSIRQNINRLTRLTNNIIDVTKADVGFLQLHLENCNIVNIIEEVTMSAVDLIESHGISIEFDTDVEEKVISCDIDKIERIVLNLLSNSVKFTPHNGQIFVKLSNGSEFITISVKDTGIGIPKDMQEIIFDRFRQVDKSISRNHEGSGIGLSLVRSLVELHGGTIKVESTLGQGSEFIIQLPVMQLKDSSVDYYIKDKDKSKVEMEFSDIYS